jgi:hypothetical protein
VSKGGNGRRNYFDNPFEQRGDLSHASIFIVAIALLVGVAGILFYGNHVTIPADPTAALGGSLPAPLARYLNLAPPTATPVAAPGVATTAGAPAPTAKPGASRQGVVAANGNGAAICRTPNLGDQLLTWPDGTGLELLGEDRQAQGSHWLKARDPLGNTGWVLAQYVQTVGQ